LRKYMRNISLYIIVFFTIIVILMAIRGAAPQTEAVVYTYGDLIADIANGRTSKIAKLEVTRDTDISGAAQAKVYFTDNTNITVQIPSVDVFMGVLRDASGLSYDTMPTPKTSWLMQYVPMLVITLLSILLLMFLMQQMQGGGGNRIMSFGRSKAKVNADDKNKITFAQVAGLEEEKAELAEIVEFLRAPKKFTDIGARIPKGVLLVGPPGTGKTYLARAVSGEAGVPYFSISGSDFVEMFVGVGASRVRDLFDQAKKSSPCVIFIDEIDAVGRRRGAGLGGGHDEREQTLNQLLVEMDGFGVNEGIIIIAATNRPDILDPALLRPGRFDRQIVVGKPDVKGREAVLRIHAKGKSIGPDVDFAVVAHSTAGFTPADLENMLNEAAILAARENKTAISMEDIRKAFIKVGVGTEKKSRVISDKEKRITAYHEAGHAIIHEVMSELDPTYIVSIIPTGMAGGYNVMLPGEDKSYHTKRYMEQEISAFMGGRVAEALVLHDITTGASNDIKQATAIARDMVTKYGMSEALGPIQFGDDNDEVFIGRDLAHTRNYGENVASKIDAEIKRIVDECYKETERILTEFMSVLHEIARLLIEKERVTGEEIRKMFPYGALESVKEGFMASPSGV